MKNIHLLPTDKPSRFGLHNEVLDYAPSFGFDLFDKSKNFRHNPVNIYITSDEEKGDWCIHPTTLNISKHHSKDNNLTQGWKKIILTTDQDLIADGIEQISENTLLKIIENINSGKNIESFDEL
jgi:hypothetical protein